MQAGGVAAWQRWIVHGLRVGWPGNEAWVAAGRAVHACM